jgi:D-alanine-D-alanine ligase
MEAKLGLPLFVKPANLGSSVGISKVKNKNDFDEAINQAFEYDTKTLIEEFVDGREIECAVLGNQNPIASGVGEIIPNREFYSYEAKYIDERGAALEVPAKLPEELEKRVRNLAIKTFKTLCCEGLARVDFFLKRNGSIVVNELNTMPGFTKISMYPRLWEAAGVSYSDLVDQLIGLAIERFQRERKLKTSR